MLRKRNLPACAIGLGPPPLSQSQENGSSGFHAQCTTGSNSFWAESFHFSLDWAGDAAAQPDEPPLQDRQAAMVGKPASQSGSATQGNHIPSQSGRGPARDEAAASTTVHAHAGKAGLQPHCKPPLHLRLPGLCRLSMAEFCLVPLHWLFCMGMIGWSLDHT